MLNGSIGGGSIRCVPPVDNVLSGSVIYEVVTVIPVILLVCVTVVTYLPMASYVTSSSVIYVLYIVSGILIVSLLV